MEKFEREVNKNLKYIIDNLSELKEQKRSPNFWEKYYVFICESYQTDYKNRFSISHLSFYLKENDFKEINELLIIYIHGLYLLAKFEGRDLYGTGFNP